MEDFGARSYLYRNSELFDKLMYICWALDRDGRYVDLRTLKLQDLWKSLKEDADIHSGDCTYVCCTCIRCMLQRYEVDAENLYLFLKPYLKEETKEKD